jgi:uncharacterized protein (TIGR03435 family)
MRLAAVAILAGAAWAQSAGKVEFEVASVKPGDPMSMGSSVGGRDGRYTMRNNTLKNILLNAFSVRLEQIDGGPKWLESARFDIDAKLPVGASRQLVPEMLRNLLADRFQLVVHRETRMFSIYALVIAKGGPRIQKAAPDEPRRGEAGASDRKIYGRGVGIGTLAGMLSGTAGGPVFDRTGLEGEYDFSLEFAPGNAGDDETLPSVFAAVQQTLGLRLEATKGPMEVIVIDRAEKPSEN